MRVLVACEFSGIVRDAFRERGHDAWSCDLLRSERPGNHFQNDVRDVLERESFDLMIAHPPCTYLCRSGQRWLKKPDGSINGERWAHLLWAVEFFNFLLDYPIRRVAVENPMMHCHARERIRRHDQIVQPWEFGHPETKATCLWLKGLPPLMVTAMVQGREGRIHNERPAPDRGKKRSVTYAGIATAMAEQWGAYLMDNSVSPA